MPDDVRSSLDHLYDIRPELRDDRDLRWMEGAYAASLVQKETGEVAKRRGSTRANDPGRWLNTQRERLRAGQLDAHEKVILDALCPEWDEVVSSNETQNFIREVDSILAWKQTKGRLPRISARDDAESGHARWLVEQRKRLLAGDLGAAHVREIDRVTKSWRRGINLG